MKSRIRNAIAVLGIAFGAVAVPPAVAAPTAQINGGYTLVEFLPDFVNALTSLGIAPSKTLPATLYQRIGYFPITGGRIDAATARGEVPHAGGLTLTKGATQVVLSDFIIDTASGQPKLTGIVTANGTIVGRIPLFNLALPAIALPLTLPPGPEILLIEGNKVTLSQEAATALNAAFGTHAFVPGFNIGIASIYGNY
ncbi:MAG: hypothetical protein IPQ15_03785 [Betaproteobacteria bacterium]|nr:hypothetical protein [Betaproteobacteria bacterium]